MKTKRFEKKLRLNKVTLANLDPSEMNKAKGADDYTNPGWNTIDKRCHIASCINCTWPPICQGTYYC